jgi:hypothetical protein
MRKRIPHILLGTDSHLPNHAHLVMEGADVREDSGVRESDAETRHAKGRLWQPAPFLWRGMMNPEWVLSEVEAMMACRAPS